VPGQVAPLCVVLVMLISSCGNQKNPASGTQPNPRPNSMGELDRAEKDIHEQLAKSPNSAFLHNQLAALAAGKSDWETFEKEINSAIRLEPNDPLNYFQAGETYHRRGMLDRAIPMYLKGVELDPNNPLFHFKLGELYEKSQPGKSRNEFMESKRLLKSVRTQ